MPTDPTPAEAPVFSLLKENANSTVNISGGTWNNVEGNQSFHFVGCNVTLSTPGVVSGASPLPSTSGARYAVSTSRIPPGAERLPASCHERAQIPNAQFLIVRNTLQLTKQLMAPHTSKTGILGRLEPRLRDLEILVDFSSSAYDACGGRTTLWRLIRAAIETRMEKCNTSLTQLHTEIASLPHRSFPRIRYAHRVIYEWWTGNEPEEILAIRQRISEETTAIGEWLCCLHSFWWASSQLLLATSSFTMKGLHEFLHSGPVTLLRDIDIEEIIFLEPLQGDRRSIPIRFVESFEDVHMAIEMACKGTAASRFIEARQYQLDESFTDAPVDEEHALQRFEECKEFEVSIILGLVISSNVCPRCSHPHGHQNLTGWLKCTQCGTKFNGQLTDHRIEPVYSSRAFRLGGRRQGHSR
ncbi:hypothetical protein BKA70DRAFT_140104 [Coprinopsis sp. MPI-PUGE-AT-0042]|nr:hypothetical protein BKA70DRAFT_140104 [Coprinopsis sp. MPI-PUGE-AT-0042]